MTGGGGKFHLPIPSGLANTLIGLLVLVLGAVTITIAVTDDDNDGKKDVTVTVKLDGPRGGEVVIPKAALAAPVASEVGDHEGSRGEAPVGTTPAELEAADEQQERLAASDQLPIVTPDAAPQVAGCRTRLVGNYSTRRGVRPRILVAHYTVSANRPGWGDVNAIVGLFDQPRFAASSNYVIDNEGHCAYIVRESDKAWTQAGLNPVSISVELVNSGREKTLAGKRGLRRIGKVFAGSARRWHIPVRKGRVSGCTVTRSGIVDHNSLGPCGGGHVDVTPYKVASVVSATKRARAASKRAAKRRACAKRSTRASRARCARRSR